MIKAIGVQADGRKLLIIGLSFRNLDILHAEPRDTYITIDGKEIGLPIDVVIFSGETEAHCTDALADAIDQNTKLSVNPRLKSTAKHAGRPRLTHCWRGHDLSKPANIRILKNGQRQCKRCQAANNAERYRERKQGAGLPWRGTSGVKALPPPRPASARCR